jgi:hypothetical protein
MPCYTVQAFFYLLQQRLLDTARRQEAPCTLTQLPPCPSCSAASHPLQSICSMPFLLVLPLQPSQLMPPAPTKQQVIHQSSKGNHSTPPLLSPAKGRTTCHPAAYNPTCQQGRWPCHVFAHVRNAYLACQHHLRQPNCRLPNCRLSNCSSGCCPMSLALLPCPSVSVGARTLYRTATSCCVLRP